jgi:hypothetical protein
MYQAFFAFLLSISALYSHEKEIMTFKEVQLDSLIKSECSPKVTDSTNDGLYFTTPHEINWGDPLPVCGFLKVNDDNSNRNFEIRIFLHRKEPYKHNNSFSSYLGDPQLQYNPNLIKQLKETKSIYFNFDGLKAVVPLPPGDYQVSLEAFSGLVNASDKLPLKILDNGWRKKFSDIFIHLICKEKLMDDLAPYLKLRKKLLHETPATQQQARDSYKEMGELWMSSFSKHSKPIPQDLLESYKKLDASDGTISHYINEQLTQSCPNLKVDYRDIDTLLMATRSLY